MALETETETRTEVDAVEEAAPAERPTLISGRYEVIRELGRGASARTLLAKDTETGKQVAIKELRPEHLESWKHFELFEREARVLASLRHHGVPEVFGFFEEEDEEGKLGLFLVQEFVEGTTLAERIKSGPRLSQTELIQLTTGLLDILDHLHSRTPPLFHRDIKPSNIMIRPSGSPVLIDFGGVCDGWRKPDEGGSTVIGTHGYAPPEQYMGQVSAATDLYALGATLLHVLGGKAPSEYSFDTGRIELPAGLDGSKDFQRLLDGLLEPAPRERPQSAREARELLLGDTHSEPSASTALVKRPANDLSGVVLPFDHPQFVELPEAPRDPKGDHQAVYRNLVPTHVNTVRLRRAKPALPATGTDYVLYLLMFLCTLGFWPVVAEWIKRSRKKKYRPLFENGTYTKGKIITVATGQSGVSMAYEFEVEGRVHRGSTMFGNLPVVHFGTGDPIGVLYDPDEPSKSCAFFK